MLAVQLFVGVVAVALAGWTLAITNEVMRERDRLEERVVQLEAELATRGIVVPDAPTIRERAAADIYPAEIGRRRQAASQSRFDPRQILSDLAAPPELQVLVVHARSVEDGAIAERLGAGLGGDVNVIVNVLPARDPRPAGYAYYDGRHSRAAAALVARFTDGARREEIPLWSAQLRGTALPAQGEFTADRMDIVLPALPALPPPAPVETAP